MTATVVTASVALVTASVALVTASVVTVVVAVVTIVVGAPVVAFVDMGGVVSVPLVTATVVMLSMTVTMSTLGSVPFVVEFVTDCRFKRKWNNEVGSSDSRPKKSELNRNGDSTRKQKMKMMISLISSLRFIFCSSRIIKRF